MGYNFEERGPQCDLGHSMSSADQQNLTKRVAGGANKESLAIEVQEALGPAQHISTKTSTDDYQLVWAVLIFMTITMLLSLYYHAQTVAQVKALGIDNDALKAQNDALRKGILDTKMP